MTDMDFDHAQNYRINGAEIDMDSSNSWGCDTWIENAKEASESLSLLVNEILLLWLGIRDDYRTLIGVEDSKIIKKYDDENEEDVADE